MDSVDAPVAAQEVSGATEQHIPVSLSLCASDNCSRRPEWRIAAVDHDGATIRDWLACSEHRGQTATLAWRVEPAIVEIRQYEVCR